jgi:predicted TIM-barrel fold metal-dependent hydrolase
MAIILSACFLLLATASSYASQNSEFTIPQIPRHIKKNLIDIHAHIACESKSNGCYINERFKKHWKYSIYLRAFGVSKKEFETQGDDIIPQKLSEIIHQSQFVNKAVVLGLDGFYNSDGNLNLEKTQILVSNSFILQQTQKHANLLYGPSIHPLRKDALSELEKAKTDGAVLVKWLPCIMGIDPSSKDPRITAFYRKLIELNIPLLSHTGDEHSFMDSDNTLCDPEKLKRPLSMGVKVIAAHLGTLGKFQGEPGISRMNKMMNEFPELKFDISSLVNINKFNHIKYAHDYPGRYYYGSDYPLIRAQFLGLPLSSHIYYKLKITKEWSLFIDSFKNEFDQDVALKLALGVPLNELEKTIE